MSLIHETKKWGFGRLLTGIGFRMIEVGGKEMDFMRNCESDLLLLEMCEWVGCPDHYKI